MIKQANSGLLLTALVLLAAQRVEARNFRVNQIPNGNQIGCVACHVNPNGGGTRNVFGQAVGAITGSANRPFWTASLAALDSDNDGFSNGVELGDPEGDFTTIAGWSPTRPGDPNSKPALQNQAPQFTSVPVAAAFQGESYEYQATATDPENTALSFSKVSGPAWLTVSAAGLASGTPPDLTAGDFPVTLRVTDSGSPAKTADQAYTLTVRASFAGWQAMHFDLPTEAGLAAPLTDADGDGLANLGEYALRRNPRLPDAPASVLPVFGPDGSITLTTAVRDDDPRLSVSLQGAGDITFAAAETGTSESADPVPGDGLRTVVFRDDVLLPQVGAGRFWRLLIELLP